MKSIKHSGYISLSFTQNKYVLFKIYLTFISVYFSSCSCIICLTNVNKIIFMLQVIKI